jgi:hypothetical protein
MTSSKSIGGIKIISSALLQLKLPVRTKVNLCNGPGKAQELELKEREGNLSKRLGFANALLVVSEARSAILSMPKRLMEPLALETDPKEVYLILKESGMQILTIYQGTEGSHMETVKRKAGRVRGKRKGQRRERPSLFLLMRL